MHVHYSILLLICAILSVNALPPYDKPNIRHVTRSLDKKLLSVDETTVDLLTLTQEPGLKVLHKRLGPEFDPTTYDHYLQVGNSAIHVAVNFAGDQLVDWLFQNVMHGLVDQLEARAHRVADLRGHVPGGALSLTYPVTLRSDHRSDLSLDFTWRFQVLGMSAVTWHTALRLLDHLAQYTMTGIAHDLLPEFVFYIIRDGRCYKWITGSFTEHTSEARRKLLQGLNATAVDLLTLPQNSVVTSLARNATSP